VVSLQFSTITQLLDTVVDRGSVVVALDSIPADFVGWRRLVRDEAARRAMTVAVREVPGAIAVHDLGHRLNPEQIQTAIDQVSRLHPQHPSEYHNRRHLHVVRDAE
jgi:hypothetical protein